MKKCVMEAIKWSCSWVLGILILVDILIKIVIDVCFMNVQFYVFDGLGFKPFLNTEQLSVFNNEFNMGLSLPVLFVINIISILGTFYIVEKYKKVFLWNKIADIGFKLVLAGTICSFIDKVVWGGSLDYILFFGKIVDLKDIYLVVGFVQVILSVVLFENNRRKIRE